ncbi:MAG TPA: alpha/beta hydrolase [Ktedonobacterales bacterium]|jgi:pimeloyl-ACP methyl ester carboxylesterase
MNRTSRWPLLIFLFLLAACGSGTPAGSVAALSPTPTPTPGITPTPTIPTVAARLVHFMTSDHVRLAGLLYGRGKTAIICSHELFTTKAIWRDSGMPQRLAQLGYLALAYDFRGYGDSLGVSDLSVLDVDLRAAVGFARQQGATKIVLMGSSMGGSASLKVAATEPVTALITLSAPQQWSPFPLSDSDVQAISAPKLFVNSEYDDYADQTTHMYTIATEPKQLRMYPGVAHGTAIFGTENGASLIQLLLNFIARYAPAS